VAATPALDLPYKPDGQLFQIQLEETLRSPDDVGEDEVASGEEQEESSDDSDMEEITGWRNQVEGGWIKRPRKRSSEELDDDADGESVYEGEDVFRGREKRPRHHEEARVVLDSPRLVKRRSEELDGGQPGGGKRMRIRSETSSDRDASPPTSISGTGETVSVPSVQGDEEEALQRDIITYRSKGILPSKIVGEADLDGLYTFGSETSETGAFPV
jgi:hypothetical protein